MTHTLEFVAVCDIDGSMMTKRMELEGSTPEEAAAAQFVRDFFDRNGTFCICSAQTIEMLVSSKERERSPDISLRPYPFLGVGKRGEHFYVRPESIPCRIPFTNAPVIMSMGTGCYSKRGRGKYRVNKALQKKLGLHWRKAVIALLHALPKWGSINLIRHLGRIDSETKYYRRRTNVFPNDYRVQLVFADASLTPAQNELQKNATKSLLQSVVLELFGLTKVKGISSTERATIMAQFGPIFENFLVVDESRPLKNHFQIYLMPVLASKEAMADVELARLSKDDMIKRLIFFGDMPPDLKMGCLSGKADYVVFVLAGGSPLAPYFTRGTSEFGTKYAGEDMGWIYKRLKATGTPGIETFCHEDGSERTIIVGDAVYPGLIGPETLAAYLKEHYPGL